jgi:uncharacterized phage-associated protein
VISVASAHDVAAYILAKLGRMSTMKLQKLVYYCQAWHLVWAEERLFPERVEAWANGPVVYELFDAHRGRFTVDGWPIGDPDRLDKAQAGTVDAVIATYGHLDGGKLSYLTHAEEPWRKARAGLLPTEMSRVEITPEMIQDYYSAVAVAEDATPVDEFDWGPSWAYQDVDSSPQVAS